MNTMRSNPNRYWGEVGGRIVWSKGTKAYVAYPETDKWITIPLRQLLQ